jgi:purine nucleoside permease
MQSTKKMIEKHDFEITKTFFVITKIINIDISNDIKTKNCM